MQEQVSTSGSELTAQSDEDALDALIDSYVARMRAGETPAIEAYQARRPELSGKVAEVLCLLNVLEDWKEDARDPDAAAGQPAHRDDLPRLSGYKIVREIGRGGMGVVYEAWDENLLRRVALKILPDHLRPAPAAVERFVREARAAAALEHPHIVPVYGVGEEEAQRYYVMQYIPGRSLDQVLVRVNRCRRTSPLQTAEPSNSPRSGDSSTSPEDRPYSRAVAALGLQAAEALSYAHARGVLHRDIKPSNLLLDERGTLWVTDFGLAKLEGMDSVTATGEVVGTFRYMAPERFSGESLPAGDMYSLGLTLYELLAGKPAFEDSDRTRLVQRILTEEPPALTRLKPGIPRNLERIIEKCTVKEPSHRYGSATELVEDLRLFLERRPLRWARRPAWTSRAGLWCRRNPLVAGMTACIVALAALLLLSTARGSLGPKETVPEGTRKAEETRASRLFEEVQSIVPDPEARNSIGVDVADFDGDGRPDIITLGMDSDLVTVLLQGEDRSFRPLPSVTVTSRPAILVTTDIDGDRRPDVVIGNRESADLAILTNESKGQLRLRGRVALGFSPFGLVALDLNNDKQVDLVAAGGDDSIRCLENDAGTFRVHDITHMDIRPSTIAGGDFFGSGRIHLAVVDSSADQVSLIPWSFEGPSGTEVRVLLPELPVAGIVAHFDTDGRPDLAVASYKGGEVSVVSSTGKGEALSTKSFPSGNTPISIWAGDVDGDKLVDIVVANELEEGVSVLRNLGDDGFEMLGLCTTRGLACSVRVVDLDGDDQPDLVVANGKTNTVGVLWHRPVEPGKPTG